MEQWRILLVDDESGLTGIFRILLEGTGRFLVREENLGTRAVATARQFRPHLIFLAMDLPDRSGLEIVHELHAGELAAVPIVLLTGTLTRQESRERQFQGAQRALAKPFSFTELLQTTSEVLALGGELAA